jgi:thiol:disulfide interchange protein
MEKREIVTELNRDHLASLLQCNPGVVILKFTAEWCKPCKTIQDYVYDKFRSLPNTCICADLDVDDNFDLYALMKSKKQVRGIPALLAYKKGNITYAADASVSGSDTDALDFFFKEVSEML